MGSIVLKLEKQKECFERSTDHMKGRPLRICRRRAAMTCNGHSNFQTIHRISACCMISNSQQTLTLDQMVYRSNSLKLHNAYCAPRIQICT